MEIKSVPPVVAFMDRHRLIAKPLIIPPNILIKRISYVTAVSGMISVMILVTRMEMQEYNVNFLPINRQLI